MGRSLSASRPSVGDSRRQMRHWARRRPSQCLPRDPRHEKTLRRDLSTTVPLHRSVGPSWYGVDTPIGGDGICVGQLDRWEGGWAG